MEKKFEFKPMQWVLARFFKSEWILCQFSHVSKRGYFVMCGGKCYPYCIPYKGNKHLRGTTDDYVESYEPKDGDFVIMYEKYIAICKNPQIDERNGGYKFNVYAYSRLSYDDKFYFNMPCTKQEEIRPATEEEKQLFLSKLAEFGKKWNPEKKCIEDVWTPKDGDFVYCKGKCEHVIIFRDINGDEINAYIELLNGKSLRSPFTTDRTFMNSFRPATESEKQQLLDALHKEGKGWSEEKKEIVEYKWKPNTNGKYYYVNSALIVDSEGWTSDLLDEQRYRTGNCFRIYDEAQAMADKFKELLKGEQ